MSNLRLNVGCGFDKRAGYTNVDLHAFHDPDLVADIVDMRQVADESAIEVLALDVLEHVPKTKVLAALVEWNRVLRVGGLLRIRVPDLVGIAQKLLEGTNHQLIADLLYGTQSYDGDFHMAGFTFELVGNLLEETGFELTSSERMDGWLICADATKRRRVRSDFFDLARDGTLTSEQFVIALYRALGFDVPPADLVAKLSHTIDSGARDRYQLIQTVHESVPLVRHP